MQKKSRRISLSTLQNTRRFKLHTATAVDGQSVQHSLSRSMRASEEEQIVDYEAADPNTA